MLEVTQPAVLSRLPQKQHGSSTHSPITLKRKQNKPTAPYMPHKLVVNQAVLHIRPVGLKKKIAASVLAAFEAEKKKKAALSWLSPLDRFLIVL